MSGIGRPVAGALRLALAAVALSLGAGGCSGDGGRKVKLETVEVPPGTLRAVFFEYVAHCKRSGERASAAEPESSCEIEVVGASILEPDRNNHVRVHRELEVAHAERAAADAWNEQGVELIAYGPNGSAAFSTRAWHDYQVWTPGQGPAKCVGDPHAADASLPEAERKAWAFEPMAKSIETLFEIPPRLRLDLRPYVLDLASMLEAQLLAAELSDASRERISQHLAALDEAMRSWGVDWLATRSS